MPSALSSQPMGDCCSSDLVLSPLGEPGKLLLGWLDCWQSLLCSCDAAPTLDKQLPSGMLQGKKLSLGAELTAYAEDSPHHSPVGSSFPQFHVWHGKIFTPLINWGTPSHTLMSTKQGPTGIRFRPQATANYTNWLPALQILTGRTLPSNTIFTCIQNTGKLWT